MFVVPIVFLAFATTACEEALRPVAKSLQQNELTSATALLDRARPQCAGSGSFHEFAGIISTLHGDFSTAAQELQQAFTLNPRLTHDSSLFLWFAQALIETNQAAPLNAFLAIRQRDLTPPLLFSLAGLFAKHADYKRAIKYLQQIPPALADDAVYFNLGLAYSHLRQFEAARKCYFRSIDLQSAHVEAYFRVGLDFAASGDPCKALPWLFRAREFAPARPDIAYALIEQLLPLRYFDTAAQIVAEALTANPQNPPLIVAKGDLLLARGKIPEAVEIFKQQPGQAGALLGLARAEISQGNTTAARQTLLEAFSLEPANPTVNGELGSQELEEGKWHDAYDHLSKAWSSGESNPTVALLLARALEHMDRSADALQLLQSLGHSLHRSSAFHSELAQIYTRLGRTAQAQAERNQIAILQAANNNSLHFEDPKTYVH